MRGLIDAIVLTPQGGELKIERQGNLAAMLKAAQMQSAGAALVPLGRWGDERAPGDDDLIQIMLVAGAPGNPARRLRLPEETMFKSRPCNQKHKGPCCFGNTALEFWLRGLATAGTCSCGAARRELVQSVHSAG